MTALQDELEAVLRLGNDYGGGWRPARDRSGFRSRLQLRRKAVREDPDGQTLASGSADSTITLWDVRSGNSLRVLKGHSSLVYGVAWSPDGQFLASGSGDSTVILWDASSGDPICILKGHSSSVYSVAWSPDGQTFASGSSDRTIIFWDVGSGNSLCVLKGHSSRDYHVAFTPDGRYKFGGDVAGGFWHAVHLCRFEPGELDPFVPGLRIPNDAPILPPHLLPRQDPALP